MGTLLGSVQTEVADAHSSEIMHRARSQEQRRAEIVDKLLADEPVDAGELAELGYELDGWHLGVIATGAQAGKAVRALAAGLGASFCRSHMAARSCGRGSALSAASRSRRSSVSPRPATTSMCRWRSASREGEPRDGAKRTARPRARCWWRATGAGGTSRLLRATYMWPPGHGPARRCARRTRSSRRSRAPRRRAHRRPGGSQEAGPVRNGTQRHLSLIRPQSHHSTMHVSAPRSSAGSNCRLPDTRPRSKSRFGSTRPPAPPQRRRCDRCCISRRNPTH